MDSYARRLPYLSLRVLYGRRQMEFAVTLVQMPTKEGDRLYNFGFAKHLLKDFAQREGTDFIILPELFAIGFRHEDYKEQGP